ncbi:unnamed protein product [Caenorhabditis angaria]|uniref:PSI domain-containing protein n=1 Tax=Caenorhabditis angaria TaxID=860376 RepID=A0A9P1IUD2_9PELO|nr:unnamed protein product [Caenorhabditis angaria]
MLKLILLTTVFMGSVTAQSGNMTWDDKTNYCKLTSNDINTCESCIGKGSNCFWCGGSTKQCMPFDWYYPGCNIKHVKYNVCWVSTSAAAIIIAICAGIIVVLLISCVCYCCCKWRNYNRIHKLAKAEKWAKKQETKKSELEKKHSERSDARKAEMDVYRQKYGLEKSDGFGTTSTSTSSNYKV